MQWIISQTKDILRGHRQDSRLQIMWYRVKCIKNCRDTPNIQTSESCTWWILRVISNWYEMQWITQEFVVWMLKLYRFSIDIFFTQSSCGVVYYVCDVCVLWVSCDVCVSILNGKHAVMNNSRYFLYIFVLSFFLILFFLIA